MFSDQPGAKPFVKMIVYFDILTRLLTLNLELSLLFSLSKPTYVLDFTSPSLILIVL